MSNTIRRPRHDEELALAREIVSRHPLPSFITGFDIRFGDFDGEPAMWVIFETAFGPDPDDKQLSAQLEAMRSLREAVQAELLATFEDRWPYFRFDPAKATEHKH